MHPTSATPRLVGIWDHLRSAHSEILQEEERVKDWDLLYALCMLQHQNKRGIFVRWSGKGGPGERRKRWGLRSIPPASPLSLAAQGIWGGGGTKPSYNSAVHLSATCKWTRGLILLALRMKSSQGRSPGPREKNPFSLRVIRKR